MSSKPTTGSGCPSTSTLHSFHRLPRTTPRAKNKRTRPDRSLFHPRDKVLAMRRPEHQIHREPRRLGERVTQHGAEYRQNYTAVLQRIPWRMRPGDHDHDEESER